MWGTALACPDLVDSTLSHYSSFSINEETITLGDAVCLYAAEGPLLVGTLTACFLTRDGESMLQVRWFKHAARMHGEPSSDREVIELMDTDVNPVGCVAHKARVFRTPSWAEAVQEAVDEGCVDSGNWYWCRSGMQETPLVHQPRRNSRKAAVAAVAAAAAAAGAESDDDLHDYPAAPVYSSAHMLHAAMMGLPMLSIPAVSVSQQPIKRRKFTRGTHQSVTSKPRGRGGRSGKHQQQQRRPQMQSVDVQLLALPRLDLSDMSPLVMPDPMPLMVEQLLPMCGGSPAASGPCPEHLQTGPSLSGQPTSEDMDAALACLPLADLASADSSPSRGDMDVAHGCGAGLPINRRCLECGAVQTPQWREGPTGPKTLCNACGVRYGRQQNRAGKRVGGAGVSRVAAQSAAAAARAAVAGVKRKVGLGGHTSAPGHELVRLTAAGQKSSRPVRQAAVLAANRTAEFARTGVFPNCEEARASAANNQHHHHMLVLAASIPAVSARALAPGSTTSSAGDLLSRPSTPSLAALPAILPPSHLQLPRFTSSGPSGGACGTGMGPGVAAAGTGSIRFTPSGAGGGGYGTGEGMGPGVAAAGTGSTTVSGSHSALMSPSGSSLAVLAGLPSLALAGAAGGSTSAPSRRMSAASEPVYPDLPLKLEPAGLGSGAGGAVQTAIDMQVAMSREVSQHSAESAQEVVVCPRLAAEEEVDGFGTHTCLDALHLSIRSTSSGFLTKSESMLMKNEEVHGCGMGGMGTTSPWEGDHELMYADCGDCELFSPSSLPSLPHHTYTPGSEVIPGHALHGLRAGSGSLLMGAGHHMLCGTDMVGGRGGGLTEGAGGNGLLVSSSPRNHLASPAKLLPSSGGGMSFAASPAASRCGFSLLGRSARDAVRSVPVQSVVAEDLVRCKSRDLGPEDPGPEDILDALSDCMRLQLQGTFEEMQLQGLSVSHLMSAGAAANKAAHEVANADAALAKIQQVLHARQAAAEEARAAAVGAASRMCYLVSDLVAQHPHLAGDHDLQVELAGALTGMGPDAMDGLLMPSDAEPCTTTPRAPVAMVDTLGSAGGVGGLGEYVLGLPGMAHDMGMSLGEMHDDELMLAGLQPVRGHLHDTLSFQTTQEDDGLMLAW